MSIVCYYIVLQKDIILICHSIVLSKDVHIRCPSEGYLPGYTSKLIVFNLYRQIERQPDHMDPAAFLYKEDYINNDMNGLHNHIHIRNMLHMTSV